MASPPGVWSNPFPDLEYIVRQYDLETAMSRGEACELIQDLLNDGWRYVNTIINYNGQSILIVFNREKIKEKGKDE